jgi:hypothetical protein
MIKCTTEERIKWGREKERDKWVVWREKTYHSKELLNHFHFFLNGKLYIVKPLYLKGII